MKKYEGMFILRPDLTEADRKSLFTQINDSIAKNEGNILQANVWSEKRRLSFPIKKFQEGVYYLVNFNINPEAIAKIRHIYNLNENILRVLITVLNQKAKA